ncbi:MAG: relaxase/mobilization nuclease domain-containing protein [Alphaproteobacteria bacterium]
MIIKSHIRGGYRSAAAYLKAQGGNERIRTVEISDPDAKTLDEAFKNMWEVASNSKARKPLHHISINPMKDERLTDEQVLKIVERCEQKYGYKPGDHQRVIVEHVKDGRQHFHVMWNRVSLTTGKVVKSGEHWKKSKQAAREMEKELGLKRPTLRRMYKTKTPHLKTGRLSTGVYRPQQPNRPVQKIGFKPIRPLRPTPGYAVPPKPMPQPVARPAPQKNGKRDQNIPDSEKLPFRRSEWETAELIAWAWENNRYDILAQFGFFVDLEP